MRAYAPASSRASRTYSTTCYSALSGPRGAPAFASSAIASRMHWQKAQKISPGGAPWAGFLHQKKRQSDMSPLSCCRSRGASPFCFAERMPYGDRQRRRVAPYGVRDGTWSCPYLLGGLGGMYGHDMDTILARYGQALIAPEPAGVTSGRHGRTARCGCARHQAAAPWQPGARLC
jgi:hypothetical protein